MSSSINVYAVPVAHLKQVIGSRDQTIIDAIAAAQSRFLASIDDIDDEGEIQCAAAVADLVNGTIKEDVSSYLYGYAFEAICAQIGKPLQNICPIAGVSEWIEGVDALLESHGIPVRLATLVFAGSPISIPEPDEYPFIGHWPADKIAESLEAFRSLNLAAVDKDMAETLSLLRIWLDEAGKIPAASVIGFLS